MRWLPALVVVLPALISQVVGETSTPNTGDQESSFLFSFSPDVIVLPQLRSCPSRIPIQPANPIGLGSIDAIGPFVMTFMVNEMLLDPTNGTLLPPRVYAHTVLLDQMTVAQTIPNPLGANGTQFIACMWGTGGKSGGCHDLHTIAPSEDYAAGYATNTSSCRTPEVRGSWVTPASRSLDVSVAGVNGPIVDPRSWPASCSDLQFTPKNGTPPYTLVIAPAYHPPVNITGNSTSPLNYTIRLTHGQAFFAAMFDKSGSSWAMGPFHAGTTKNVSCLSTLTGQLAVAGAMATDAASGSGGKGVGVAALGGGIAGAFLAGAVLAGLAVFCLGKRRKGKSGQNANESTESLDGYTNPRLSAWRSNTGAGSIAKLDPAVSPYTDINSPRSDPGSPQANTVLPYDNDHMQRTVSPRSPTQHSLHDYNLNSLNSPSGQDLERAYRNVMGLGDFHPSHPVMGGTGSSAGAASDAGAGPSGSSYNLAGPSSSSGAGPSSPPLGQGRKSVYVVHSDGGNNVHIQLPEGGADVVELPPNYNPSIHTPGGSGSRNEKSARHTSR